MPRKLHLIKKLLEDVPPNHFIPRQYHLDLLDAAEERNTVFCKNEEITLLFAAHELFNTLSVKHPDKFMLVIMDDRELLEDNAKAFSNLTHVPVFIASESTSVIPPSTRVVFILDSVAVKLLKSERPVISIPDKVFLLIVDECENVLIPGHPYEVLFPSTAGDFEAIWNRCPSYYSNVTPGYRILGLASNIIPSECSDPVLAKRHICSLEDRLKCRLETTSELINILSFGAQPEEQEILPPENPPPEHPIHGTMLRLLQEASDFLNDLDFTGSEENVSTENQRVINVPYYCLRAVAQCEAITKELGAYCGALIARVFLRHLFRLERARAAILEARKELEHAEDLLTRILRYTATQLAMVARLFQVACDECMTREEMLSLASPRVNQLLEKLRTVKPTGSYRIVRTTLGADGDVTTGDEKSDDSAFSTSTRRRRNRSRGGFVEPHSLEGSESESDALDDFSGIDDDEDDDDDFDSVNDESISGGSDSAGEDTGAESDATDISMGLYSDKKRKRKSKKASTLSKSRGGNCKVRETYKVISANAPGEIVVPPLCGILLVGGCQFSAYALPRFIEEYCNWDPEIAFVRPGYFFVPTTSDPSKPSSSVDVGAVQEETFADFRSGGNINLLVTTQSGLAAAASLPRCNLVASFHPTASLASYLAAKSRLRLVAHRTPRANFWHFLESEQSSVRNRFQEMEKLLVQRCSQSVLIVGEHEVDPNYVDDKLDYLPKKKASRSINVINHYCARLPCNFMTRMAPRWNMQTRSLTGGDTEEGILSCPMEDEIPENRKEIHQCYLQLPITSPLTQVVVSQPSYCKKMAKYSAAVRAGQLLYDLEEIDSHGVPILRHSSLAAECRQLKFGREAPNPRTKSFYLIKTPYAFVKCLPKEDRYGSTKGQNYLYLITATHLDTYLSQLQRENRGQASHARLDFYPERENRVFGLLTSKPIPIIPEFRIYTRTGEEAVQVYQADSCPVLSVSQLNKISQFHRIIFKSVLRFERDRLMVFNLTGSATQLLLVPVFQDTQKIDWELIDTCLSTLDPKTGDCILPQRRKMVPATSIANLVDPIPLSVFLSQQSPAVPRFVFDFAAEDFENAVLTPSYRLVDNPPRYYVVTIRNDMSPASKFPSNQYDTFADYYRCKYNLRLSGDPTAQPLLDAIFTPLRLAPMLTPRKAKTLLSASADGEGNTGSGGKEGRGKGVLSKHVQLLVPEFCHRHAIPATVWQKAVCLPGILYRLHHLLLAEELRSQIAKDTGMGIVSPPYRSFFPPLTCPKIPEPGMSEEPTPREPVSAALEKKDSVKISLAKSTNEDARKVLANQLDALILNSDLEESGSELEEDDEDDNGEEVNEEEVDAKSVDSFEETISGVKFFPSQDNDCVGENAAVKDLLAERPCPSMILQSVTLMVANDFMNMERLETIGDSFLKFAVTMQLYFKYPDANEGLLSLMRSHIVENANLYRLGCEKGLPGRIVGVAFEPSENWLPPGYACASDFTDSAPVVGQTGQGSPLTHQYLTNKSIADCVESLVGCYLVSRGERSALRLLQWFGVECLPPSDQMQPFGSPWKVPEPKPLTAEEEAEIERIYQAARFAKLEETLGYRFKNRRLLIEAFTHSTCRDLHRNPSPSSSNGSPNILSSGYERLEFLGDAVLDYAVTRVLFYSDYREELSPGALTDLRSALVNNALFGVLAVRAGLHTHLRATCPAVTRGIITAVAAFCKKPRRSVRKTESGKSCAGENPSLSAVHCDGSEERDAASALAVSRKKAKDSAMDADLPKALGDIFESLAGAVFLDSGLCLNTLWRVFLPFLRDHIERYSACVAKSPVRMLVEYCPDRVKFESAVVRPDGYLRVGVRVAGVGRFFGIGRTYRLAKTAAADLAYQRVRELEKNAAKIVLLK